MQARSRGPRTRVSSLGRAAADDSGAALVDFIGLSLLFLIPVTYLVVTLSRIEAATFAAESASSSAARSGALAIVRQQADGPADARSWEHAQVAAQDSAARALADFGFSADEARLELACVGPCASPGSDVGARVTVEVSLPGVPGFLEGAGNLSVTVEAQALQAVDSIGEP